MGKIKAAMAEVHLTGHIYKDIVFYTHKRGNKYFLKEPLALSYYKRYDDRHWHHVNEPVKYLVKTPTGLAVEIGDMLSIDINLTLMKYTKAAYTLYGYQSRG